ncbi:MAG: hypothetical protein V1793_07260 [Pseudomonadota bacterium]
MSMFTEELLEKVSAQTSEPGIVITSFRTVPLLSGLPRHIRVISLKTIYIEHEPMLSHIPRIMTYNRFHDDEGISILRKFIRKNPNPEDEVHGNNRH